MGDANTETFPARRQAGGGEHQGRAGAGIQEKTAPSTSWTPGHAAPLSSSNPQCSFSPPDPCIHSALCLRCHSPTSLPGELQFLPNSNVISSEGFPAPPGKMRLPGQGSHTFLDFPNTQDTGNLQNYCTPSVSLAIINAAGSGHCFAYMLRPPALTTVASTQQEVKVPMLGM